MRKVIRFTKIRYIMITMSLLVITAGYIGLIVNGGFNLGIDFKGGLVEQVQIVPVAFKITYTGPGKASVRIAKGETIGQAQGRLDLILIRNDKRESFSYSFKQYKTLGELINALKRIEGIKIESIAPPDTPTSALISLDHTVDITKKTAVVNRVLLSEREIFVDIAEIRNVLSSLGKYSLQRVGNPRNQEFIIRVEIKGHNAKFRTDTENKIYDLLSAKYGRDKVIVKMTDFVGPRFSKDLASQAVSLIAVALVLILIYVSFRFKMIYAVAAILALVHDVSVMLGVIGTFRLEVTSGTIAAVLTIIGYSLNDTIVIFDRIRENVRLMRDSDLEDIINTSITQSLSRTIMTSLTTLLAVLAIYIFGTGSIKLFALNLIVGIVVGTYSSIFIASPIVLGWQRALDKRRAKKEALKYGKRTNVIQMAATAKGVGARESANSGGETTSQGSVQGAAGSGSKKDNVVRMPVIRERRPPKRKKKKKKK